MIHIRKILFNMMVFSQILMSIHVQANDNTYEKKLNTIKEMAITICGDINPAIKEVKTNLSVEATAQTNTLFSSLVKGSGKVSTGFEAGEYFGVLRKDLGEDIKNNRDCRIKVVSDLSEKILGKSPDTPSTEQGKNDYVNIINKGKCSITVIGSQASQLSSSCDEIKNP